MKNFEQAILLIESARRILITCHVRPDGDGVGSIVALKNIIEKTARQDRRDCEVQLLLLSTASKVYQFLFAEPPRILEQDITQQQIDAGELDKFDLIIVADTSATRQLKGIADYLKKREQKAGSDQSGDNSVLIIDHHLSGDIKGNCLLINTKACAAGEIVYDLCREADWPLDEASATALLAAIGTDTGWFRFENTSARTFEISAALIQAGARAEKLYQKLYQNYPPERLRLVTLALETLELHAEGQLATMQITGKMLAQSGAKRAHIENIVNEPQQIGSVIAVLLFVELDDGGTRVSLRSKAVVDVNELARQFGGGGHARAAGITMELSLEEARLKIIDTMLTALKEC
jgi:bifunctional oligoribonuclease and PAP phosphatase NrnA